MGFGTGTQTVFKLDDAGGTLTDISFALNKVDYPETAGAPPSTTFGARAEDVLDGAPTDGTISTTGVFDDAADAVQWAALSRQRSYEYGPFGSGTGNYKVTGECIGTGYTITGNVDGTITTTATYQLTGVQTPSTY